MAAQNPADKKEDCLGSAAVLFWNYFHFDWDKVFTSAVNASVDIYAIGCSVFLS